MRDFGAGRDDEPRFAYSGLDRILHERGRLAVCTCLVAFPEGLSFSELRDECGLTDGNLNRHLQALADFKIVELRKVKKRGKRSSASRRAITIVRITPFGRERFLAYIDALESVVRDAQARASAAGEPADAKSPNPAESGLATT